MVVLTAFGSLEGAIEAIKQGAYDYLAKPFKKEDIKLVVKTASGSLPIAPRECAVPRRVEE